MATAGSEQRTEAASPESGKTNQRNMTSLIALLGGIVAIASGLVALLFIFLPNLKPEPLPPERLAELSDLHVDPDARFSDFIATVRIEGHSASDYTREELDARGAIVTFNVRIVGYRDIRLPLDWHLFDASTGEKLRTVRETRFVAKVNDDSRTKDIWVALPDPGGQYYVTVELLLQRDNNFVPLRRLTSDPFSGPNPTRG